VDLNKLLRGVYGMAAAMMGIGIVCNIYATWLLAWHNWMWVQKIAWICTSLGLNIIFIIMFSAMFWDIHKKMKALDTISEADAKKLLEQYQVKEPNDTTKN
jgi:glucan phosphoethanolaminetransferase (alkaline phosphatase superfamily)